LLCPPSNQPEHDLVFTPRWLAADIIQHFRPSGLILDSCRGSGAFFDQFPKGWSEPEWCEIEQGRDFFSWKEHVDWIITNPPWSKFREFLIRGMLVADNVVYLVTINHFMTKARLRDMAEYGFRFREIYAVDTPVDWPQTGFQLAAVWIQRGYVGDCTMSGLSVGLGSFNRLGL
jgi:hypothetical protein